MDINESGQIVGAFSSTALFVDACYRLRNIHFRREYHGPDGGKRTRSSCRTDRWGPPAFCRRFHGPLLAASFRWLDSSELLHSYASDVNDHGQVVG